MGERAVEGDLVHRKLLAPGETDQFGPRASRVEWLSEEEETESA